MEATQLEPADWLEDCIETATGRMKGLTAPDASSRADIRRGCPDSFSCDALCVLTHYQHVYWERLKTLCHFLTFDPNTMEYHSLRGSLPSRHADSWLEENYEIAEGVCIPRSALYTHYLDFCDKNDSTPVNAASFGKIIRQQFPQITTRRLGTRGQSKYHYYGIGVKDSSSYYEVNYSKKGVHSSTEGKKESVKQIIAYSPRSKLGTLLPDFPDVGSLKLPPDVAEDKVQTFVMMYRTHCQRILDTVIRANFDEVQSFLLHFWQGMPQHIVPILGTSIIVSLVGVCDSILYKAISGVLMPTVLQSLPDSLTQVIRKFAKQLDDWLRIALDNLPEPLRQIKFDLARRFGQLLRRQTSLNHLCQASRTVIHSSDITGQMLDDWAHVDLCSISKQTLYTMDRYSDRHHQTIVELYKEFEMLLEDQAPIESYTEWLEAMVDRCVIQPSSKRAGTVRRIARQFLLMWSCFGTRVIRDMTLHSAPSFGSFHLLHLMFDDYVLFLIENLHSTERSAELLRQIKGEQLTPDPADDLVLPNPSTFCSTPFTAPNTGSLTHLGSPLQSGSSTLVPDRQTVITDTRDVYTNNAYVASSPQSVTSRDPTSPITSHQYDDGSGLSPNNGTGSGGSRMAPTDMQSESQYHYGRYYGPQQPMTSSTPDNSYNYNYLSSQYQYTGRESARDNTNADWSDGQRYTGPLSTSSTAGNFSTYGATTRGPSEYDNYASCDPSAYNNDNNASGSSRGQGVIYHNYGPSTADSYYSDNDVMSRKRKSDIDNIRNNSSAKRTVGSYDYSSYAMAGSYARA